MDPAQLSDLYSRILTANMFDSLYGYDYLMRPVRVRPMLADGMPQNSADFRTFTVRLRHGILFADDPAFGGKKRELTAQDVVYTYKRVFDPKVKSPSLSDLEEQTLLGLPELRKQAQASGKFDYDREVEGLRALDRYTVQFKLAESRPRFILTLADPGIYGIVAREVVEKYGDQIMEHPVGTGPFVLQEWQRSSKLTFVRNPNYREEHYNEEASPDDASAQAISARLKGKRLPIVDKVVVSIIDEPQPRWLSFLNNEHDLMQGLPASFATYAIPNNKLAPNLAKRGMQMDRQVNSDISLMYFNMEDPLVGGYTPEKVALRRAIGLGYNSEEAVRLPRHGQAIVAQGLIVPDTSGYDPAFRSEMGTFDRGRAIALLDMYGYTDKDGDGWRDQPDGKPLVLEMNTQGSSDSRELDEILKKNMDALGIKVEFKIGKWPEQLKAARPGKLMMWQLGFSASNPDGGNILQLGTSNQVGQQNLARFRNAQFDKLYDQQSLMEDGPERNAVMKQAVKIMVAYMPYKVVTHRIGTDLMQPWLIGYKRHPYAREFWRYVDIDTSKIPK
ncbi:ABC transporter substrate-binding protein [Caenimonas terrae]|uniref:ABC transporter substrate-binding protein n=1 Tax=Caenimonas terrae TaxID=696074 RepID=A0ABW0NGF2_9BURK